MGATTLYHPVSLNVIRGAAEFSGFKLGKVQQLGSSFEKNEARYRTVLVAMPEGLEQQGLHAIRDRFQACFLNDIEVTGLWYTPKGEYVVGLKTCLLSKESREE